MTDIEATQRPLDERLLSGSKWHVLLWSHQQNAFHIESVDDMLAANRAAYAENRSTDYVPILIGSDDFCHEIAGKTRATLRNRSEERARLNDTGPRPTLPRQGD
jgi:hypothetical protein